MKLSGPIAIRMILSCAFVLMLGCDDEAPPLTLEQKVERALAVIEKNQEIVDDVMIDGRIITSPSEYNARAKQVQSRDLFIAKMIEDTEMIYAEAAFNAANSYKVIADPAPLALLRNYLKLFPAGYTGPNGTSLIDMLKQETTARLNRHADNEKHILLNDWSFNTSAGGAVWTEAFSLNFEEVKLNHYELEGMLISSYSVGDSPGAIKEMLGFTTPAQVLFIQLLLPAVLKPRSGQASYDKLINDTFDFTPDQRKQFDHDVRIVAYEIAVQYLISEDYNSKNEYEASLEINRRVFNAMMAMVAAAGYDLYK